MSVAWTVLVAAKLRGGPITGLFLYQSLSTSCSVSIVKISGYKGGLWRSLFEPLSKKRGVLLVREDKEECKLSWMERSRQEIQMENQAHINSKAMVWVGFQLIG